MKKQYEVEVTMTRTYKKIVIIEAERVVPAVKAAKSKAICDGFNESDFDEETVQATDVEVYRG